MSGFDDDCAQIAAAADNLLARSAELKMLRVVNPGEARKIAGQIEVFEKRFADFLARTEEASKLRAEAKAWLEKFARFRKIEGGQVEALETKFTTFLTDTEAISDQRDVAEQALLKFASARSLLNGEAGN